MGGADAGPSGSGRLTPRGREPSPEVPLVSGVCPGSAAVVAGVMASRLLRGAGALAAQALRTRGPSAVAAVRSMASGGGVPTDDDQATGLEREVMMAARKGLDPYNMLAPKAASGTKEDPNLVPSITNKRIVGCICKYLPTIFLAICLAYLLFIQDVYKLFQIFCVNVCV